MAAYSRSQIVDTLDRFHQRATYGAVAALCGKSPRSVMQGLPRNWRHSWVVNQSSGEPTDYHELMRHPSLFERDRILVTPDELAAWLRDPR